MRQFARPSVVVSRCIEFDHCRWNGDLISSDLVRQLKPHVDFSPVCPETDIGLGVPRKPLRLVRNGESTRLLQPDSGRDVTDEMRQFCSTFLGRLGAADGAITKGRSPTSALKDAMVYASPGRGAGKLGTAPGLFGSMLIETLPHGALEDEGRLRNPRIKAHFLTKLFLLAEFRTIRGTNSGLALREFQSRNELLFRTYGRQQSALLARLAAEAVHGSLGVVLDRYEESLHLLFARAPRCGAHADALMETFDRVSGRLGKEEAVYFRETVQKYRDALLPLSVPLAVVRTWLVRFKDNYLLNQSYLQPYPDDLVDLSLMTAHCDGKDYWQ
jgi:uncharacterized protein YbgA (DUF1722 family)/uncharacterized protein YbbK (DUF523 family)